jgi:papain like protease
MADTGIISTALLTLLSTCALAVSKRDLETADRCSEASGSTTPSIPEAVDLRPRFLRWNLEPRRQGPRGTCSVFTVVGALEYALAARSDVGTRLSVEFLNWAAHRAVNRSADGGFFSELWRGYSTFGICPEADFQYRATYDPALHPDARALETAKRLLQRELRWHGIKEWDVTTGLNAAQIEALKTTLAQGWPVCGGFRWPKQPRWDQNVLQLCAPDEVYDGHSVLLVGYRDDTRQPGGGAFIICNSGGDAQDCCLPYDYVLAYMNDAAWVEGAEPAD